LAIMRSAADQNPRASTSHSCMSLLQGTGYRRMGIHAVRRPIVNGYLSSPWRKYPRRGISCAAVLASGHNRWSKIRHDKGNNDAAKSKARSILSADVILASKRQYTISSRYAIQGADVQQSVVQIRHSTPVLLLPSQTRRKALFPKLRSSQPSPEGRANLQAEPRSSR
jgi:hypothetical protein